VPAGLSGVIGIAAGNAYSLALKRDGTVVIWGQNQYNNIRLPAGLSGITRIFGGPYNTVATKNDGTVTGWAYYGYGTYRVPADLVNPAFISSWYTSIALQEGGTVVAWSDDGNAFQPYPIPAEINSNVSAVAAGGVLFVIRSPASVTTSASDIDGDGLSDILWENTSTGDRGFWIMNGQNFSSWVDVGIISPALRIVGTGDFNGDGMNDLVWENTSTGKRVIWFMNGTTFVSSYNLGIVATAWHIAAVADFNADG
jgi:hypothetical protein